MMSKLKFSIEKTETTIDIRIYEKKEQDKIFLLRGNAMSIDKNGKWFKSGPAFKILSAKSRTKLIEFACNKCNLKVMRGDNYEYIS